MTDHHDTAGATARPRLTPLENVLAFMKLARRQGTTMSIWADDVKAVEDAINEHEPLKARLAEVEGQRAELASKLSHLVDSLRHAEARARAAEARIAALEKALEQIAYSAQADTAPILRGYAQDVLAAEQKEAGK